jgi:glucosamine--fructose-6-phosphate aminotransferase (isomerizing)
MKPGEWMEREIREQPKVLQSNANRYYEIVKEAFGDQQFDLVLLAARGSSDNAALLGRYLIEIKLGIPVCLAAPSVFTQHGTKPRYPENTLAIGVSQSGAAPDVSEVIEVMNKAGHATLAVTNTEGSRLSKAADATVLLNCGEEKSVAATKTYTASLLTMIQVARALGADVEDPASQLPGDDWTDKAREQAESVLSDVLLSNTMFSLGRGYSFCSAYEGALKMMECALIAAKPYSTADFLHGPRALARHGSVATLYGEASKELAQNLSESGCTTLPVETSATGPVRAIWEIFFGQWLALLAAKGRGLNPDEPQHLKKVTMTV